MKYPDTDGALDAAIDAWRSGRDPTDEVLAYERPWRSPPDEARLQVSYRCQGSHDDPRVTARVCGADYPLDDPVLLEPIEIPQPWGREIWFTGIEARGESRVRGDGGNLSLASYLALGPERICRRKPILLLKILAPRPEPVLGELYLEVHAEKREVYVVTRVDSSAWPDGEGRVLYGVDQTSRARYPGDAEFRQGFLEAVSTYEQIRRDIDAGQAGLENREHEARQTVRSFMAERALKVGDVIMMPTWVPHSLQPGIQVIEFQTPTYERYIISSTQAVVTQEHWNSSEGIAGMTLDETQPPASERVGPGIERIARFDDFAVWRAELDADQTLRLPEETPYAVATCVTGELELAGPGRSIRLGSGQAALIPAGAVGRDVTAPDPGISLLAGPGL